MLAKAPAHLRKELVEDYRRVIYGDSRQAVKKARLGLCPQRKLHTRTVSASFEEAGDELFTLVDSRFRNGSHCATNALEPINEALRRRTKTQTSLPSEDAVPVVFFAPMRGGPVTLRPPGRLAAPQPT